jgi:DNA polymerase elongation subunit (family B)
MTRTTMEAMYGAGYVNGYVDGNRVTLISRGAGGRIQRSQVPAEYVAYFREEELTEELMRLLTRNCLVAKKEEGGWLRFVLQEHVRRNVCLEKVWKNASGDTRDSPFLNVPSYEGDVDPVRRFLTDSGAEVARPRRAYTDIETDSRVPFSRKEDMRVLSWGLQAHDTGEMRVGVLEADTDGAEAQLLGEWWEALEEFDQVAAWYGGEPDPKGDGFDFPVIMSRSMHCNLRGIDAKRLLYIDHLEAFRRMNQHASESGDEKQSMALDNIAHALLGSGKAEFDASKTWEAWAAGGRERARMVRYMIRDVDLLRQIELKTKLLDLFSTLCGVFKLFADTRSLNPTQQVDAYMLSLARERGVHRPTKRYSEGGETTKFKGAFVMEPDFKGITRSVHVADFSGMYPSIIRTWNMSADTKVANAPVNGPIPEGQCRCPKTGTGFRVEPEGILSVAVGNLIEQRKKYKDLKASLPPGTAEWVDAERLSDSYKVGTNIFFGVVGSPFSPYFDRAIAEGITQNGAWLIEQTIAAARQRGWHVGYGDTDSIYVKGPTAKEFKAFVEWCNKDLYPRILKSVGCTKNYIELAYEKEFDIIVFVSAKRYAGKFSHYKGKAATADSKPEVKGLEFKRGDSTKLARDLQKQVVDLLMAGEEGMESFHALLSEARCHVLEEPLPLVEVVQRKEVSKGLKEYAVKKKQDGTDAAQPPHVVVAKMLKARGQDVSAGTRVGYVVLDDEAEDPGKRFLPEEDYKGECDRHYVWQSLVYPPTKRLLEAAFPDEDSQRHWEAWSKSRPSKKAMKAAEAGQGALFREVETRVSTNGLLATAPPMLPKKNGEKVATKMMVDAMVERNAGHAGVDPYEVKLDEARVDEAGGMEVVRALLAKHPGKRPVVLYLALASGKGVVLDTKVRVDGSAALAKKLAYFQSS